MLGHTTSSATQDAHNRVTSFGIVTAQVHSWCAWGAHNSLGVRTLPIIKARALPCAYRGYAHAITLPGGALQLLKGNGGWLDGVTVPP